MAKYIGIAYFLWLCGGLFGWHHLYLRRDKQALVWFATFGGFFFGLLFDLVFLPGYVRKANAGEADAEAKKEINTLTPAPLAAKKATKTKLRSPAFAFKSTVMWSMLVGSFFSYVAWHVVPQEKLLSADDSSYLIGVKLLAPFLVALGVYFVGTQQQGTLKCEFRWPLLGSSIAGLFNLTGGVVTWKSHLYAATLATFALNWNIEWTSFEMNQTKMRKIRRAVFLLVGYTFLACVLGSFIWHNGTMDKNGERVPLKQTVTEFFNSKQWNQIKEGCTVLNNFYQAHGFMKLANMFIYGEDGEKIANAYKVIGISERASQKDLNLKCKALSRKYHPDKYVKVIQII
jgi:DnaJ family protein C protein 22